MVSVVVSDSFQQEKPFQMDENKQTRPNYTRLPIEPSGWEANWK